MQAYGPINRFTWRRTGRTDPETGDEKLARIRPPRAASAPTRSRRWSWRWRSSTRSARRAAKAAIFTGRVVAPRNPRLGADTPADALAICLDTCGEVRLTGIARLLGAGEEQARQELGTLVFDDPATGRLVPAAEYLSGNVRDKLEDGRTGRGRRSPLRRSTSPRCARSSRPT